MLTLPFWAGKKLMTLPWIPPAHHPFTNLKCICHNHLISNQLQPWRQPSHYPGEGGRGLPFKRAVNSSESFKSTPKSYQDPVFWAWHETFSPLRGLDWTSLFDWKTHVVDTTYYSTRNSTSYLLFPSFSLPFVLTMLSVGLLNSENDCCWKKVIRCLLSRQRWNFCCIFKISFKTMSYCVRRWH